MKIRGKDGYRQSEKKKFYLVDQSKAFLMLKVATLKKWLKFRTMSKLERCSWIVYDIWNQILNKLWRTNHFNQNCFWMVCICVSKEAFGIDLSLWKGNFPTNCLKFPNKRWLSNRSRKDKQRLELEEMSLSKSQGLNKRCWFCALK